MKDEYHVQFHYDDNGKQKTGAVNVKASSKSDAEKLAKEKAAGNGIDEVTILSARSGPHYGSAIKWT